MKTNQQLDTIYTPYCYLIGWKKHNKFYYGARWATKDKCLYDSGCHPDDLWVTYTTSSEYVNEFREKYGEPDVLQVRKTFNTAEEAQLWEKKVITKTGAVQSRQWLNQNNGGVFIWSEEIKNKVSKQRKGKKLTKKHRQNISSSKLGKKHTKKHRQNISSSKLGKKHTKKHKRNISSAVKGQHSRPIKIYSKLLQKEFMFVSRKDLCKSLKLQPSHIQVIKKGWLVTKRSPRTKHPFKVGDYITLVS